MIEITDAGVITNKYLATILLYLAASFIFWVVARYSEKQSKELLSWFKGVPHDESLNLINDKSFRIALAIFCFTLTLYLTVEFLNNSSGNVILLSYERLADHPFIPDLLKTCLAVLTGIGLVHRSKVGDIQIKQSLEEHIINNYFKAKELSGEIYNNNLNTTLKNKGIYKQNHTIATEKFNTLELFEDAKSKNLMFSYKALLKLEKLVEGEKSAAYIIFENDISNDLDDYILNIYNLSLNPYETDIEKLETIGRIYFNLGPTNYNDYINLKHFIQEPLDFFKIKPNFDIFSLNLNELLNRTSQIIDTLIETISLINDSIPAKEEDNSSNRDEILRIRRIRIPYIAHISKNELGRFIRSDKENSEARFTFALLTSKICQKIESYSQIDEQSLPEAASLAKALDTVDISTEFISSLPKEVLSFLSKYNNVAEKMEPSKHKHIVKSWIKNEIEATINKTEVS